jgi:uncharacterized membrane protein
MNAKRAVLAAAAAALFTTGLSAMPDSARAEGEKVHCEGVNGCKGQTDCAGAGHDCSGKNACKGKGWKSMTAEECAKAKAEMKQP